MRTPLIAGNWKLHLTEAQALTLVRRLLWQLGRLETAKVEVLICPPFTALSQLHKLLVTSKLKLGAQNLNWKASGAYTGEISPVMLAEFCQYVIVGHSERRAYFGETDAVVNKKVRAAIEHKLIPIMCVGESLDQREAGKAEQVVYTQMIDGLKSGPVFSGDQLVIAYEPVWAIGTGKTATPDVVNKLVASTIRPALTRLFGEDVTSKVRVLYGGSVNPGNAAGFLTQVEIDGALVGGASLDANSFMGIVEAAV
jgi:triosephosphate isomerase